jgi:hypothetical protein
VFLQDIKERGLRRWLNENPKIAGGVGGGLVVISLLYVSITLFRSCNPAVPAYTPGSVKSWYATEDGQNLYADDALLVPPFQKDGKTFYRAYVFKCPTGTQFVNHIEMYTPEAKTKMEEIRAKSGAPMLEYRAFSDKRLIKRAGGPKWLAYSPQDTSARNAAQRPQSKDCSGDQAVQVSPPGQ